MCAFCFPLKRSQQWKKLFCIFQFAGFVFRSPIFLSLPFCLIVWRFRESEKKRQEKTKKRGKPTRTGQTQTHNRGMRSRWSGSFSLCVQLKMLCKLLLSCFFSYHLLCLGERVHFSRPFIHLHFRWKHSGKQRQMPWSGSIGTWTWTILLVRKTWEAGFGLLVRPIPPCPPSCARWKLFLHCSAVI